MGVTTGEIASQESLDSGVVNPLASQNIIADAEERDHASSSVPYQSTESGNLEGSEG